MEADKLETCATHNVRMPMPLVALLDSHDTISRNRQVVKGLPAAGFLNQIQGYAKENSVAVIVSSNKPRHPLFHRHSLHLALHAVAHKFISDPPHDQQVSD